MPAPDLCGRFGAEEAEEFDRIMAELEDDEVQEMKKMSMAQWWTRDALEEGLKRGHKQGVKQGEVSLLKRQLRHRFDRLPQWIDQRLKQASRQELESWAERVLDAESLDEVFAAG